MIKNNVLKNAHANSNTNLTNNDKDKKVIEYLNVNMSIFKKEVNTDEKTDKNLLINEFYLNNTGLSKASTDISL